MTWALAEETYGLVGWEADFAAENYFTMEYPPYTFNLTGVGGTTGYALSITYPDISYSLQSGGILRIVTPSITSAFETGFISRGSFSTSYPKYAFNIFSYRPNLGQLIIEYPRFILSLRGLTSTSGNFQILGPHAKHSYLTEVYNTLVFNTDTLVMPTTYTNFSFNSIVEFNGNIYLANDSGLFQLTGSTDNNSAISASLQTHDYDLKSMKLKGIEEILVSIDGGPVNVGTVHDSIENSSFQTVASSGFKIKRVKHPKGLKQMNWGVKLSNIDGSDFEIDKIALIYTEKLRHINQGEVATEGILNADFPDISVSLETS